MAYPRAWAVVFASGDSVVTFARVGLFARRCGGACALSPWASVALIAGGMLFQVLLAIDAWVHRRSDGERDATQRLDRLDRQFAKIEAKASEDAGKWQAFIGRVEVDLAVIKEKLK